MPRTRPARLARTALLVVLTVLLAGAAGALVVAHQRHGNTSAVVTEVRAALASQLPAAQRRLATIATRMDDGHPAAYSWQDITCRLGSDDAGLTVQGYHQECTVRQVDLVRRPRSAASHCLTGAVPGSAPCTAGLAAPLAGGDTVVLRGVRPDPLPSGGGWTVVVALVPLDDVELGCQVDTLFCDAPVDGPVLPAVPD